MSAPEHSETDPAQEGSLGQALGCLALVVGIVALIAAVVWGIRWFRADTSSVVHMELTREPAESSFELEDEAVVQVWADLEITHPGISPSTANDELPHMFDYVIEIRGPEGLASELRCNPFDSHVARTSGTQNSVGQTAGRSYDGRLEDCAVRLPAGAYTIRAVLEPVEGAKGHVRLDRSGLILRRR